RRSAPAAGAHGDTIERIVVGIGVNLLAPPQACAIGQPACGLIDGEMLPARTAETVIGALAGAVVPAIERFLAEGLAPFVAAWRRFDALDGRRVTLVDGERVLASGRALGLDESRGLRVRTAGGMRVLRDGEGPLRLRGAADGGARRACAGCSPCWSWSTCSSSRCSRAGCRRGSAAIANRSA